MSDWSDSSSAKGDDSDVMPDFSLWRSSYEEAEEKAKTGRAKRETKPMGMWYYNLSARQRRAENARIARELAHVEADFREVEKFELTYMPFEYRTRGSSLSPRTPPPRTSQAPASSPPSPQPSTSRACLPELPGGAQPPRQVTFRLTDGSVVSSSDDEGVDTTRRSRQSIVSSSDDDNAASTPSMWKGSVAASSTLNEDAGRSSYAPRTLWTGAARATPSPKSGTSSEDSPASSEQRQARPSFYHPSATSSFTDVPARGASMPVAVWHSTPQSTPLKVFPVGDASAVRAPHHPAGVLVTKVSGADRTQRAGRRRREVLDRGETLVLSRLPEPGFAAAGSSSRGSQPPSRPPSAAPSPGPNAVTSHTRPPQASGSHDESATSRTSVCAADSEDCRKCRKLGEGCTAEVYLLQRPSGEESAVKVIPVGSQRDAYGELPMPLASIIAEGVITRELSNLRFGQLNQSSNFIELKGAGTEYDLQWCSENSDPSNFEETQFYVLLEFENGGKPLERFKGTVEQLQSVFLQVACSLAVAEPELEFEHRDLHCDNVLVKRTEQDCVHSC
ncbi:hypothetical protein MTO96_020198 [Rhipicephalus appendiculatus]